MFLLHVKRHGWSVRRLVRRAFFLALFCLALGACFASAGHAASMLPGVDLAIEQKKQSAISLLRASEHEAAYDAFMQLLREEPDDDDINMGIALSAYGAGRYPQSLMAYERLLAKYPHDASLRVQVARVYIALDEIDSARLELEKARLYDPSITDKHIEGVLKGLSAQASRWQYSGRISAGIMYDDNSNQGPRSNYMNLGVFENLFVDGVKRKASWGNYLSGSLEVGYRLGEQSPWWVMGDVMGYQRWNTSSGVATNNSFSFGRTAMGFRHLGERSLVDLRVKGDTANQHHRDAEDQNITSIGPELTFAVSVHPRVQLITRGTTEKRDYTVSDVRDGEYWSAAQYVRVFVGESNHEIMAGVMLTGNEPEVHAYKYHGVEPSLRLVIKLPYDVSISPFVSFREEYYKEPATGLETERRRDKQWRYGGSVAWDITEYLTLDATYQFVDNDSNSALYIYEQNTFNMGLTYRF